MRHDLRHLLGEQADVQRVQHRAHGGHGKVGLEVLAVVPAESRDALAALHAQCRERVRQRFRMPRHVLEQRDPDAFAIEAAHRTPAVQARAVAEDHLRGERQVHHRRLHGRGSAGVQRRPAMIAASCNMLGTSCSRRRE